MPKRSHSFLDLEPTETNDLRVSELKSRLSQLGKSTKGTKADLVARLEESIEDSEATELNDLRVSELKSRLSHLGKSTKGTKADLVARLEESIEDSEATELNDPRVAGLKGPIEDDGDFTVEDFDDPPKTPDQAIEIKNLKLPELKSRLVELGEPTSGNKAALIARLQAALENSAKPLAIMNETAFDLNAFLHGGPPSTVAKPASKTHARAPTIVGFRVEQTGSILCTDPAFPDEFKKRSNQDFASTKNAEGATQFTYSKGGQVRLTAQTIILKCGNDARHYMEGHVTTMLKAYNFRPVVNGIYFKAKMKLHLAKNTSPAGGYVVSGDTAFVHFNGVFNFKEGENVIQC
jgi:predicted DNA-binding protein